MLEQVRQVFQLWHLLLVHLWPVDQPDHCRSAIASKISLYRVISRKIQAVKILLCHPGHCRRTDTSCMLCCMIFTSVPDRCNKSRYHLIFQHVHDILMVKIIDLLNGQCMMISCWGHETILAMTGKFRNPAIIDRYVYRTVECSRRA